MKSIKTKFTNHTFGAPIGWDQTVLPCDSLDVVLGNYGGVDAIQSYWKLSKEELEAINMGAVVELSIVGHSMPPIALEVKFEKEV